jgi:pyruvate ferredoxin oxidoreductase gamma subunit
LVEEIRIHGIAGQGVVACGELIAIAASYENKFCRAFPMYGSARRGAPVLSFAQIGDESEATRSMIYYPEYLLVMDPLLPEQMEITQGLKNMGVIVYNTKKTPDEAEEVFKKPLRTMAVIDATEIAVEIIGRPIPNTVILGAFTKATGLLKLESVFKAIDKKFPERLAKGNKKAAQEGYSRVMIKEY